ncbi:hypothetical protein H0X48_02735 [Candidatus Dependentiae bacterium]|nr:hypothetical protein [Candidatus Dependentiae bacterium]
MWSWQLKKLNQEQQAKYGSIVFSVLVHGIILLSITQAGSYKLLEEAITLMPKGSHSRPVRFGATRTAYAGIKSAGAVGKNTVSSQHQVSGKAIKGATQVMGVKKPPAPRAQDIKRRESLVKANAPVKNKPTVVEQKPVFSEFKREFSSLIKTGTKAGIKTGAAAVMQTTKAAKAEGAQKPQASKAQEKPLFSEFRRVQQPELKPEKNVVPVKAERVEVVPVEPSQALLVESKLEPEVDSKLDFANHTNHSSMPDSTHVDSSVAFVPEEYSLFIDSGDSGEVGQYSSWQQDIVTQIQHYIDMPPGFEEYTGIKLVIEVGHTDGKAKTIEGPKNAQRAVYQAYKSCILKVNFPKQVHGKRITLIIS